MSGPLRLPLLALLAGAACAVPIAGAQEAAVDSTAAGQPASRATASGQDRANRQPAAPKADDTRTANPLEGFLNSWMTSKDYSLLRGERRNAWTLPRAPSPGTSQPDPPAAASTLNRAPSSPNPYLAAMPDTRSTPAVEPTTSGLPAPAPTTAAEASPMAPVTTMLAPEAEAPPQSSRYQPPPPSDAKYFPQLKRF